MSSLQREREQWVKRAQSHELYYPPNMKPPVENIKTQLNSFIFFLNNLKGIELPPLVFFYKTTQKDIRNEI